MITKKRLFTPGPTMLPERVRLAMAQEMIHHRKPEFKKIFATIQERAGKLFGTSEPVLPLTASGTGAMVAAVCALVAPKEKVLVIDAGKFGERWMKICATHDVAVVQHKVTWGTAVDPKEVEALLQKHTDIVAVFGQLSETSTGVLHPIKELATVVKKCNKLLIVDGISGVSLSPCPMDDWGIDCLITGSQKGLMLPPGLALIALSSQAWAKAEQVGTRNYYFDLLAERKNYLVQQTKYTSAVSLMIGLAESLEMFDEVGLDAVYRKQWALTMMVRTAIEALGFELYAKENFAWGVTSFILPPGIKSKDILTHAAEHYGIVMSAGQDAMKDSMVRIGHMGWVDYADMLGCLYALKKSFVANGGFLGCRNYLEQAMEAYEYAMEEGYPVA